MTLELLPYVQELSANDIVVIIGAVTVSLTTVISAIATVIVAVRTGAIKATGEAAQITGVAAQKAAEETKHLVNSRTDAMMEQLERQRTAMQDAGIPIPVDPSLPMNRDKEV